MSARAFRWVGPVVVTALLLVLGACAVVVYSVDDRSMAIYRLDSEASRLASRLFFDKMTAIAQLGVGLLGAAWAFLVPAETKVSIRRADTIVCFVVANLSFALSLLVYAYGYDFIVARIFHHAAFDIDAPFVVKVSNIQQVTFVLGCASMVITILLGRRKDS